jgi:hypothetical protein
MARTDIVVNGVSARFVASPKTSALQEAFDNLITPERRGFFCYFSDDSCFSIRVGKRILRFNVDISGCDASHGTEVFNALIQITPKNLRSGMRVLVEQLCLPIVIRSQQGPGKVRGGFGTPTLFSGSTITTVINNVANLLIFIVLSRVILRENEDVDSIAKKFTLAIEEIGYVGTGFSKSEMCQKVEDLQFLKYSPALDHQGNYRPLLNLGVWFRSTGTCHGDLPGSSKKYSIEQRAATFQLSLIRGMFPRVTCEYISQLAAAVQRNVSSTLLIDCQRVVEKQLQYKIDSDTESFHFNVEDFFSRYGLTPLEIMEAKEFADAGVYEHTSGSFASKILLKDYGYGTLTWEDECRRRGLI